uniref:Uncharacterized protein n=1 Tax=Rhizophora mucronata TaxID=61149 RepID=A0A2P2PTQ9_RHIMU
MEILQSRAFCLSTYRVYFVFN